MEWGELVRHKTLKLKKNSKRRRALEYAKGIGRPRRQFPNPEVSNLDQYSEIEHENGQGYESDLPYKNDHNIDMINLEQNHNQYASEIEKIKAMFS